MAKAKSAFELMAEELGQSDIQAIDTKDVSTETPKNGDAARPAAQVAPEKQAPTKPDVSTQATVFPNVSTETHKNATPEPQPEAQELPPKKPASKPPTKSQAPVSQSVSTETAKRKHSSEGDIVALDPQRIRPWQYKDRAEAELQSPDFEELLELIRVQGQLQPIKVRPIRDKDYDYEEIFGFKRLHIAKLLGRPVLAIVESLDDRTAFCQQFSENGGRSAPSPWSRAVSLYRVKEDGIFDSVESLAAQLGQNRSTVSNMIRIAEKMPEEFKKKLDLTRFSRDALFALITGSQYPEFIEWVNENAVDLQTKTITDAELCRIVNKRNFPYHKRNEKQDINSLRENYSRVVQNKYGKLFSINKRGGNITVNILKDARNILDESDIEKALQRAVEEKLKTINNNQ